MAKTYAKKITAFMTAVTIVFSMMLYFPSGTFSNIGFGLTASAAEITLTEPSKGTYGSVWGQKIGTEDYPLLKGKKVLANVDLSDFANDIIVYGQSASLDGTIGFNIYVAADDSYEWDKTVNGVQGEKMENGLYKFTYQVG